jgi:hypothetical protein
MKRNITEKLIEWKNFKNRKPLILRGARQVGKTWVIKDFGKNHYKNIAYFNFDHDPDLASIFKNSKDIDRIIEQLTFLNKEKIEKENTLIIFDEIQECPDALNSLKYFCEDAKEYHIISAGSLLGITLTRTSFPVGKVEFLDMYPMSFTEFLKADDSNNLLEYMDSINKIENIPDIFLNKLEEKLKAYLIIGGMPEVVNSWITEKSMSRVDDLQDYILDSYKKDFSKHTTNIEANKILLIWNGIPSQLAKENKKFIYQVIKEGARAREYEDAINWLNNANVIYKVNDVSKPSMPLMAYKDLSAFKIYLGDVGLLRKMTDIDSKIIIQGNKLFEEFKGSLTENYVLNMLSVIYKNTPSYFTFDRNEIDFVIQTKNEIIPIEVKSGKSTNNTSLKSYNEKFKPNYRIRFSMNNLSYDGNLINIPLCMVEYTDKILEMIID